MRVDNNIVNCERAAGLDKKVQLKHGPHAKAYIDKTNRSLGLLLKIIFSIPFYPCSEKVRLWVEQWRYRGEIVVKTDTVGQQILGEGQKVSSNHSSTTEQGDIQISRDYLLRLANQTYTDNRDIAKLDENLIEALDNQDLNLVTNLFSEFDELMRELNLAEDEAFSYEHFRQYNYTGRLFSFDINPNEGRIALSVACMSKLDRSGLGKPGKWVLGKDVHQTQNELHHLNAEQVNALLLNYFMYGYLDAAIPYQMQADREQKPPFSNTILILVQGLNEFNDHDKKVKEKLEKLAESQEMSPDLHDKVKQLSLQEVRLFDKILGDLEGLGEEEFELFDNIDPDRPYQGYIKLKNNFGSLVISLKCHSTDGSKILVGDYKTEVSSLREDEINYLCALFLQEQVGFKTVTRLSDDDSGFTLAM